MNYRSSTVLKHAWRQAARVPRTLARWSASPSTHKNSPPVLANSFPKSGTHLLVQILGVLPGIRDWGDFWASQPSFSFRELSARHMTGRIRRAAPGELVSGHLHYSEPVAAELRRRSVVHYFIYRDPRDVVVSEAHYLAAMNRWHRLHRHFRSLPTLSDRVLLSIRGLPDGPIQYPDVARRFGRYAAWLESPDVCAINYEDLLSPRRDEVLERIMRFYIRQSGRDLDAGTLVQAAAAAIRPDRSHTFRQGGSGGWRRAFDERAKGAFKDVGSDLLMRLGYERSMEW